MSKLTKRMATATGCTTMQTSSPQSHFNHQPVLPFQNNPSPHLSMHPAAGLGSRTWRSSLRYLMSPTHSDPGTINQGHCCQLRRSLHPGSPVQSKANNPMHHPNSSSMFPSSLSISPQGNHCWLSLIPVCLLPPSSATHQSHGHSAPVSLSASPPPRWNVEPGHLAKHSYHGQRQHYCTR